MATSNKIQTSFSGGELAPSLHARVDLAKYATGLKTATNVFVHAHGGVSNRAGTQFVARVKDSTKVARLVPFAFSTTQTYILEFGDLTMRVIKDGGQVLETAVNITGITKANPAVVTANAHGFSNGNEVYIAGVGGMTEVNGKNFKVANVAANTFELQDLGGTNVNSTAYTTYTSGGTVARIYTLTTPYADADLALLKFAQSADTMYFGHPSHAPRKLTRTGHAAWTLSTITFAPSIAAPTGQSATPSSGGSNTYTYAITAVKSETLEESLQSSDAVASSAAALSSTNTVAIAWSAVSGAAKYNVYRLKNGLYGWIGATETTAFTDDNIAPDLTDTPPKARNPFSGAGDYPGCVTFHEQRLTYAASSNKPQTFWMSQSANFENFCVSSPTKDDDAITFSIAARQVNQIRHLVPLKNLLAMTSGGEWLISAGGQTDVLTPASIKVQPQGYRGSSHTPPLVVGDTILYVQEKGAIVRDLGYKLDVDGYTGNDLSVLSNHLFEGYTIDAWDYSQSPYSIIWAIRSDGVALSLTYMREHEVWAWTKHETDGVFESVAVISEDGEDAVYFVVKRTINGSDLRYIEKLHTRQFTDVSDAFFVDCGLTYSGSAATVISGLDHLEGEAVVALSNGNVVTGLTVSGGRVTLPNSTTKAHIGLPFTAKVETLNIDLQVQGGTVQGRKKKISAVGMRVEKTRGIWVGPDSSNLVEFKQRSTEAWADPIALKTGDIEITIPPSWNTDGRIYIEQSEPLPMTILAVIPRFNIGD